jgi:hypothetical protein
LQGRAFGLGQLGQVPQNQYVQRFDVVRDRMFNKKKPRVR